MHTSPKERLTGVEALRHPWVAGDASNYDFLASPRPTQDSLADTPYTLGASQFKSPSVFAAATPASCSHSTGGPASQSQSWPSESPSADELPGGGDATPSPLASAIGSAVLAPDSTAKPAGGAGSKRPRPPADIFVPESPDGLDSPLSTDSRPHPQDERSRTRLPVPPRPMPATPDQSDEPPRGSRVAIYPPGERYKGVLDFT